MLPHSKSISRRSLIRHLQWFEGGWRQCLIRSAILHLFRKMTWVTFCTTFTLISVWQMPMSHSKLNFALRPRRWAGWYPVLSLHWSGRKQCQCLIRSLIWHLNRMMSWAISCTTLAMAEDVNTSLEVQLHNRRKSSGIFCMTPPPTWI